MRAFQSDAFQDSAFQAQVFQSAFQGNAFQDNAFQTDGGTVVVPSLPSFSYGGPVRRKQVIPEYSGAGTLVPVASMRGVGSYREPVSGRSRSVREAELLMFE